MNAKISLSTVLFSLVIGACAEDPESRRSLLKRPSGSPAASESFEEAREKIQNKTTESSEFGSKNGDLSAANNLVKEGLCKQTFFVSQLIKPVLNQVVQRDANNLGSIPIEVRIASTASPSYMEARTRKNNSAPSKWLRLNGSPAKNSLFKSSLRLSPGLYSIDVRMIDVENRACLPISIGPVGVGEIFITAGQSNSANSGYENSNTPALMRPTSGRVFSSDLNSWQIANDPQPITTGTGGSPWPMFGDLLAEYLEMPVGIISVGWGGTQIALWTPGGGGIGYPNIQFKPNDLFSRIERALSFLGPNGARAILWHQGEADTILGTTKQFYSDALKSMISASRKFAGYPVNWYVAQVAYASQDFASQKCGNGSLQQLCLADLYKVKDAQNGVVQSMQGVFKGPDTDLIVGGKYRFDDLHFNREGLKAHAQGWFQSIKSNITK